MPLSNVGVTENRMKNTPRLWSISQCDRILDFSPLNHWPKNLPAVAINKIVIAGFAQELCFNYEMDQDEDIIELFCSLYPELSFTESAHLRKELIELNFYLTELQRKPLPTEKLLSKYGIHWSENTVEVAEALLTQPKGFLKWASVKKIMPMDAMSLKLAADLNLKEFYLRFLVLNPSKNHGVSIIEYFSDLMHMGRTAEELIGDYADAETWLDHLKQLRYPEAHKQDELRKENLKSLNFSGSSQLRWARVGDKSGIEIKFFVSQPSDLQKHMNSLKLMQDEVEKNPHKIWTKH